MLTQAEIAVYRRNLENLYTLAEVDSRAIMRSLSNEPVPIVAGQLRELLPAVSDSYGAAATIVAGEFFLDQQEKAGVTALADYVAPRYDANEIVQSGIGYSVAQYTKGSSFEAVAGILAGTIQRAVAGYARQTVNQNSERASVRYRRVARAGACAFCAYFAVNDLTTKETDKFHDNCHCVTVPEFDEIERPDYYDVMQDEIDQGVAAVRREREIVEAKWRKNNPGGKRRQFFATEEGSRVSLTTENFLREARRISGRK